MVHKSIFILGRQPAIGRAELESLFGSGHLEPIGDVAVASDIPVADIPFDRIGSTVRLANPLFVLPTINWPGIVRFAAGNLPSLLDYLPEGKLKLGLSVYDLPVKANHLLRTGLEFKKACRALGRSVRVVPNSEPELNSAQVIHNQLTGELGIELLFIKYGNQTYMAQTVTIQDITAYAKRDQGRPKRDSFVGMLPPKLAQTIVNLAVGQLKPTTDTVVLDPFCGTGVILQESLLMGYGAYGTDLEPRMISYSRENLEWLATHGIQNTPTLEVGDATNHQWEQPFAAVASETYLGHPLSSWPGPEKLREIVGTCNVILEKFLRNIHQQSPSGTRYCLAVPAWHAPNGSFTHLPVLARLKELGFQRTEFAYATAKDLVYYRPEQYVARELVVITV